ncbi:MAG: MarR family transcriptional regulator [Hydrogenophaga sp.]|uniref:MarR family transcriptional regulator n=1 Tax=Hydrogenophaga crocea TaxID=2716225 RepID=A0A6G8IFL1_9BURK|nr:MULTISPECIES: MarR family transcriptional regulator [Hydrogenophaga]MBL0946481.1 MarR family transcriptional regulator [Hydrogenophaga sp.]QIM51901.1 MarR family transcriptional regulator [Hydrogenophaga crocea]
MKPARPLGEQLTWRLHRLGKLTDRATAQAYADELGLGVAEGRALAAVGAFGPLSVNDLAAHAHLDKAQASRAAQMLVARELVLKSASDTDARAVVLSLSRRGAQLHQRAMALIERRNREIMGCLSAAERKTLLEMIDRLIAHAGAGGKTP